MHLFNQPGQQLHSPAFRKFTRYLARAALKQSLREEKINQLGKNVDVGLIMGGQRTKHHIFSDISSLKDEVMDVAATEKSLLMKQKQEEQLIDRMQQRLQEVDEKLHAFSHIAAIHAQKNREEIKQVSQSLKAMPKRAVLRSFEPQKKAVNVKEESARISETIKKSLSPAVRSPQSKLSKEDIALIAEILERKYSSSKTPFISPKVLHIVSGERRALKSSMKVNAKTQIIPKKVSERELAKRTAISQLEQQLGKAEVLIKRFSVKGADKAKSERLSFIIKNLRRKILKMKKK
ncbi:MAG TPA: hypothetical protein VJI75_02265 [Candidatus Nanoarchaeia archaeon]|nr:hypothetical protein [Candidatus Nanoarchaeia archaeon]